MKPLTIEELKALEVGDWVWVVDTERQEQFYARKDAECEIKVIGDNSEEEFAYTTADEFGAFGYSDYGNTWLAYKNKEQAEAKGEIMELPCKIGDKVWTVAFVFMDGWVGNKMKSESDWRKSNKVIKDKIDLYKFLIAFEKGNGFLTEPEAERRLAELKGEII